MRADCDARPGWACWNRGRGLRYTIGVEEEVMLLNPSAYSLVQSSESVLAGLSDELATHASLETHASVIELRTGIHGDVAGAVAEIEWLRAQFAEELGAMRLAAASAGTYPMACREETRVSRGARYSLVSDSMRSLARREPTLALHVHVGVPDPEDAIRVLNGLRAALPPLLALSANSPFSRGRDSGFASARTVIFQGFPRTGAPRHFSCYDDYVEAVDALIATGALPNPSFLWWDVRLQPALGTVEVRVMDAQSTLADSAALIALIPSLARLELEDGSAENAIAPEVLAENRFLAARDGLDARLIDPVARQLVPARTQVDELVERCREHADAVGMIELDRIGRLMHANGAERQRVWAKDHGLAGVVSMLTQCFASSNRTSTAGRPSRAAVN
ncbi:MAG TPA: YbdK family carboxylate-amine ligase [Solirubrobacteraceae bacterium]|nr:YbdK family carboxylate-amine ligase [Solirubrobacteraceae bacterium]